MLLKATFDRLATLAITQTRLTPILSSPISANTPNYTYFGEKRKEKKKTSDYLQTLTQEEEGHTRRPKVADNSDTMRGILFLTY